VIALPELAEVDVDELIQSSSDFAKCWKAFTPRPVIRSLEWAEAAIVNEAGRAYDHDSYPHIGAPGGPMDAFDDDRVRTIAMQWGVRLGKTFFGQVSLIKTADTNPAPMMFVSSREKLAIEVTERFYEMLRQRPCLNRMLVNRENRQRKDLIELRGAKIFVGWAKSASTLADKNIKVGHANEIDKWQRPTTSTEGDPLELFEDRFNDYHAMRKVIYESTPSIKGRSRIERKLLSGWNCSFYVPCPHCHRYQVLEFGDEQTNYGIKWERGHDGRTDPDHARATAVYICRHNGCRIESYHRRWMMRHGVWCPEGCAVDDAAALAITNGERPLWTGWGNAAWIAGKPLRDGEDASYHLSTLYALAIPQWGDFAKRFLRVKDRSGSLQTFVNQWFAKTWEAVERKTTWEELGKRIGCGLDRGIVPCDHGLVTIGVDKQQDHYVYEVNSWKDGRVSHTLAYGHAADADEIQKIIETDWAVEGAKQTLKAEMTLIDSGYKSAEVHDLVERLRKRGLPVFACRGASNALNAFYVRRKNGPKSSNPGKWIVWVDAAMTQDFIDQQLHVVKPGDPGSTTLFYGSMSDHQDYLEQLLNDAPVSRLDPTNNTVERWQRIDDDIPNDYRDAKRYALVAMLLRVRGGIIRPVSAAAPRLTRTLPPPANQPIKLHLQGGSRFRLVGGPIHSLQPGK
jgi:terminase, large subunit